MSNSNISKLMHIVQCIGIAIVGVSVISLMVVDIIGFSNTVLYQGVPLAVGIGIVVLTSLYQEGTYIGRDR